MDACLKDRESASPAHATLLSYARLEAYRENFSREMKHDAQKSCGCRFGLRFTCTR